MATESADRLPSALPLHPAASDQKSLEQTPLNRSEASPMSAEQKQMEANWKAYLVSSRATSRERMMAYAERGEVVRKKLGQPVPPPLEIIDHPDLLKRAWGWDRILPYNRINSWSRYKKHLVEYYWRNAPLAHQIDANAAGDGSLNGDNVKLESLAKSCIKLEDELMILLKRRPQKFHLDEASRINKIRNCARQMINAKCSEFPAAVIALKCITKEADLMWELVMSGIYSISPMNISSDIRQCALSFMTYKGDECFMVAATMMGSMREAEMMCAVLRKEREDKNALSMGRFVRNCTLRAMARLRFEHCSAKESLSPAGKLMHDESVDKINFEIESVKEHDTGEGNIMKDRNKVESLKGDNLKEKDKDQSIKDGIKGDNLDDNEVQTSKKIMPSADRVTMETDIQSMGARSKSSKIPAIKTFVRNRFCSTTEIKKSLVQGQLMLH